MNFRRGKYFCFSFLSSSPSRASFSLPLGSFLLVAETLGRFFCWIFTDNLGGRGHKEGGGGRRGKEKEEEKGRGEIKGRDEQGRWEKKKKGGVDGGDLADSKLCTHWLLFFFFSETKGTRGESCSEALLRILDAPSSPPSLPLSLSIPPTFSRNQ